MTQKTGYIVLPGIGSMPIYGNVARRGFANSGMDSLIEMDAGMNPGDIVKNPVVVSNFNKDNCCVVPV